MENSRGQDRRHEQGGMPAKADDISNDEKLNARQDTSFKRGNTGMAGRNLPQKKGDDNKATRMPFKEDVADSEDDESISKM
jgi:hypothetical protein